MAENEIKNEMKNGKKKAIIAGSVAAGLTAVVAAVTIVSLTKPDLPNQDQSYSIKISSDFEGFKNSNLTIDKGTKIEDLREIIKAPTEGYEVEGLYQDLACTKPYSPETVITENMQVFVKFELEEYTVTAYADTSKTQVLETVTVKYGKNAELAVPTKEEDETGRYTFVGWQDAQGNAVDLTGVKQGFEVFPKYDIDYNEYTVTINDRNSNVVLTRAGEPIERGATVHYDERLGIKVIESLGYKQVGELVVEGATLDPETGLYRINGNVTISYTEEYTTYVVSDIPKQVTVNKIVNNDMTNIQKVAVQKGDELLHGQILEIFYTTTTDYETTEFELTGVYTVSAEENLYGLTSALSITYTEVWAGEGEEPVADFMLYEEFQDGYAVVGIEEGADLENVVIPNTHGGKPVLMIKSLGDYETRGKIKSLTIPESVEYFYSVYCDEITISDGCCGGLRNLETLYYNAKNAEIYNNTKPSNNGVFSYIGNDCEGTTVIIGDSVETIPGYLFYSCTEGYSYYRPENASYNIHKVVLGKNLTSIGYSAFNNCTGLTSITIPNGVESIGDSAFYKCTGLTSITIPSSVTSIGESAFYGCTGLTDVIIEKGVTSIGESAFSGCNKENIYYQGDIAGWCSISGLYSLRSDTNTLYINGTKVEGELIIPEGVYSIESYAFYNCTGLTSVIIPSSVENIGDSAFSGCTGLTSVIIPSSVESIGDSAFSGCTGLTSVTISEGVTSIGDSAFDGCTGLTSITIPSSVESTGNRVFSGCTKLTSVTISEGVTNIGDFVFSDCSRLTSVIIPEGVTSIGIYAFSGCTGLTSVTIPEGVTCIGSFAFSGCSGLTSITIPSSVTSIGYNSFNRCYMLVEVYNLSSLNIIAGDSNNGYVGYYAKDVYTSLDQPSKLVYREDGYVMYEDAANSKFYLVGYIGEETNLVLPTTEYNYEINKNLFRDHVDITSITIPSSVNSIGSQAFCGCTKLTTVIIESAYIYKAATSTSNAGYLLNNATTVKVLASADDGTNTYLNNNYTKTTETVDGKTYNVYTKK